MRVLGIIAEYNPFHNGHLYHLQESRSMTGADYTVCVMSGDFTQRGEPAMVNKWIRSRMAVENGIDLVLELPYAFACNNAEYFAKGAIDILNRLGCVTHLSFGSESGDLQLLSQAASFLAVESSELKESIKEFMNTGLSFPKARYEAVKKCAGNEVSGVLSSANNILAVEYLKQLQRMDSDIQPVTIKRHGTGYHDKTFFQNVGSATAIRNKYAETLNLEEIYDFIPQKTHAVFKEINGDINTKFDDFFPLLAYQIRTSSINRLGAVLSATEGLENKVKKAVNEARDINEMMKAVKSKRYTETRIQRLFSHILTGLDKESFQSILYEQINYGRVLALNHKGAALLKQIKKLEQNTIPILTNINRELSPDAKEWKLLSYDILASDLYHLVRDGEFYRNSDFVLKPFRDFNECELQILPENR